MSVCRVCLHDKDLIDLFTLEVPNQQNTAYFFQFLQIHKNDGLSQQICPTCLQELTTCLHFIDKCINSHKQLSQNPCFYESRETHAVSKTNTVPKSSEQCEICDKIFSHKKGSKHRRKGGKHHRCGKCDKKYSTKAALNRHTTKHYGLKKYLCIFCPKKFVHQDNLRSHMKVHTAEKRYECRICAKKFKANRTLTMHLKIHSNERNFPCTQCEKAFINKYDLMRHLKLHEKKRLMKNGSYDATSDEVSKMKNLRQCEHCGKICSGVGDLKKHMRVHTGERPFSCKFCQKGFKSVSTLHCHERIHTKSKPYVCKFCARAFTQSSNLRTHEKIHSGHRPHHCTLCDKGFVRKRDLDNHTRKHEQ